MINCICLIIIIIVVIFIIITNCTDYFNDFHMETYYPINLQKKPLNNDTVTKKNIYITEHDIIINGLNKLDIKTTCDNVSFPQEFMKIILNIKINELNELRHYTILDIDIVDSKSFTFMLCNVNDDVCIQLMGNFTLINGVLQIYSIKRKYNNNNNNNNNNYKNSNLKFEINSIKLDKYNDCSEIDKYIPNEFNTELLKKKRINLPLRNTLLY